MNVISFLKSELSSTKNLVIKKVYVLNNNSCDMDSFISSTLLSVFRNFKENIISVANKSSDKEISSSDYSSSEQIFILNEKANVIYLPLMNCKRGELKSRLDINYVLQSFNIDENDFFYINDEDVKHDLNNSQVELILVDHNTLDPSQTKYSHLVTEIYDHHSDSSIYKNLKRKNVIFPLGSCSTLIILDFIICDKNFHKVFTSLFNPLFLISAILQDTDNFRKELYLTRWVDLDYYVCEELVLNVCKFDWEDVQTFYKNLSNAKFDEDANLSLGVENLMNKDKKTFKWGELLCEWSSLQIGLKSITKTYGWNSVFDVFEASCKNNSSLYLTLSGYKKDDTKLKILTIYDKYDLIDFSDFFNYICKECKDTFKNMKYKKHHGKKLLKIYLDKTLSRKLLEPLFNNYFIKVKQINK